MLRTLMRYLQTKLDAIHRLAVLTSLRMEKIMLNLEGLKAANDELRDKITDLETATAGVVANEKQHAQALRDLGAQIEALKASAGNPDAQQAEIDALAQAARDLASEVESKAKETAAAIVDGTKAEGEKVTEPVPEPVPATPAG
jgi:methyl-accepting chemotaxis protein